MSLRILEDKRKFTYYRLKDEEKNKIIKTLSNILRKRKEILLAVVFGSFVRSEVFRDIDVAVFTGYKIPYNEVEVYEENLAKDIESLINIPVDVVVIDYAPPWFRVKALEGTVLVEREVALAARLKFKSTQEVNDLLAKMQKIFR